MKIVSFSEPGSKPRAGVLLDRPNEHTGLDLMGLLWTDLDGSEPGDLSHFPVPGYPTVLDVIASGRSVEHLNRTAINTHSFYRLADVRLHAPLRNPPRLFAIGLNYREHAVESGLKLPDFPIVFFKLQTSIVGPGEAIVLPKNSTEPDYEAELAFVIGKGGFRIPAAQWREHVYGYTIINDVSARDIQRSTTQWSMSKSFPTFCPMGPAIVTADEIVDPHKLAIGLSIDGEVLQNSNTNQLAFGIPALIEYLSSIAPLLPGDIVSTGTPSGVGMGRKPPRWLKPGENVTVTVEGLGELTNPVIAE